MKRRPVRAGRLPRTAAALALALVATSALAGPLVLDWDAPGVAWPSGDTSRSFTLGGGDVTITFSGDTGAFVLGTPNIAQTPSGGLTPAQNVLAIGVDFPFTSIDQIPITIDFTHPGGVTGVSFSLFDVDRNGSLVWDEVQVTATDGASTFAPSLVTPGNPSPLIGNVFVPPDVVSGRSNVSNNLADANATFTFSQTGITRVTILYRYPGPSNDPGFNIISLHDIAFTENAPPVALDDTAATPADTPVAIDVLANDSDPDGDPLSLSLASGSADQGGTIAVNDAGTPGDPTDDTIDYSPPAGFNGLDSFDYTIDDGNGGTDSARVTVTVGTGDTPPVAVDDVAFTLVDTPLAIDVLANDSDADGDPLSLSLPSATTGQGGTVAVNDAGTPGDPTDDFVDYAPPAGFSGLDSFDYRIDDGRGGSDSASVSVTVSGGNLPPVAVDDAAFTPVDVGLAIDVLANDFDPNGDPLSLSLPSGTTAQGGTVAVNDAGTPADPADDYVDYTPPAGFSGTDSFAYDIDDGNGGTDTGSVTVTVAAQAPITLSKRPERDEARVGDLLRYFVELESAVDLTGVAVVDRLPPGFSLVPGSARIAGAVAPPQTSGTRTVVFGGIDLSAGQPLTLSYVVRIGAGLTEGRYVNRASVALAGGGSSATAEAAVVIVADPDFDQATVIGTVFHDRDGNGQRDAGEEGLAGVRLATLEGLVIQTDPYGRYHLAGLDGGQLERGRNFMLKVDRATLPQGAVLTTENPRVKRITRGSLNRFDFGVRLPEEAIACCRMVEVKLGELQFRVDSDRLQPEFLPVLGELAELLRRRGSGELVIEAADESRGRAVLEALERLLGEDQVRDAELRVGGRGAGETTCQPEVCDEPPGYSVELRAGAGDETTVGLDGRFSVELAAGGAIHFTEDPMALDPQLALRGPAQLPVRDGRIVGPATFWLYTNYAAFIDRAELVVFGPRDADLARPEATLALPVAPWVRFEWDGATRRALRPGDELRFLLRAYDARGRVDETRLQTIRLAGPDAPTGERPRLLRRRGADQRDRAVDPVERTPLGGDFLELRPAEMARETNPERRLHVIQPTFVDDDRALSDASRAELDSILESWKALSNVTVRVVAHTDAAPLTRAQSRLYVDHRGLSEARAAVVAAYVQGALGLPAERTKTVGRGTDEPLATNLTAEGRAQNRRVELHLSGERTTYHETGWGTRRLVDPRSGESVPVAYGLEAARNQLSVQRHALGEEAGPGAAAGETALRGDVLEEIYGQSDLARRNIPIHGGVVRVHGEIGTLGTELRVDGRPVALDADGRFAAEYLLPLGEHVFELSLTAGEAHLLDRRVPVDVRGQRLFLMALADLTGSGSDLQGSIEPLSGDERFAEDSLAEGRLAVYLKGKIKGKYLITARLDSGEEQLEDLLRDLGSEDPSDVFRRLDPDRYYPVFGDDSTTITDAPSQGKMYVRLDWNLSQLLWGNYHTGITGTEFAQYNRSLYGARLRYRSPGTTPLGESKADAIVFGSEAQTALGHSEFLGTGGSLYYLRHADLLPGSEKAHIEVRDRDSQRVVENVALERGADYEIDEIQGRIILSRPLAQVAPQYAPSLIKDEPLDGNDVFLLVDYEYVPRGFDPDMITGGARGKRWLGRHVAVGGTYVREGRSNEDYTLRGADLTLQAGRGTSLKLEFAETESSQTERFFSTDGGMSFDTVNPVGSTAREGQAYAAELRANLSELAGGEHDWITSAWYRTSEAGFSVARRDSGVESTQYGAELTGEVGERFRLSARGSVTEQKDALEQERYSLQGDARILRRGTLSSEVRLVRDRPTPGTEFVEGTLGALRYSHEVTPSLDLYATGQLTIDDDGGRYQQNDLGTVGARLRVGSQTDLRAEASDGDRGDAATLAAEHRLDSRHTIYGALTMSTDRSDDPRSNRLSLGQRSRLSDQTLIYNESQFAESERHAGLAHVFGLDFQPRVKWTLGATLQTGELTGESGVVDRDAASFSVGWRGDRSGWSSRVQYRRDVGAEDTQQWLTSNRFDFRPFPALSLLGRFNYSETEDRLDPLDDARFVEGGLGFAYRPTRNDRVSLLGKYTFLDDLPSHGQLGAGTDQRSHVLALETIVQLTSRWEVGGKVAGRRSELRTDRGSGDWFESTANFEALRVGYHLVRQWDLLLEGRRLEAEDAGTTRRGLLAGLDRHFGDHFKLGAGYNFTDFSDDLTDLDYEHRGWFVNFVTKY